jgi:hypothetical protein
VQRLYAEFPKTLDLWDKRQARFRLYSLEHIRPTASVLIDLLNPAYENGVYTCIPALAFRCLSLYPLVSLLRPPPMPRIANNYWDAVEIV